MKPGEWVRGVLTAIVYAAVFYAIKETPVHMNLSAAFRLAVLLLVPVRIWPSVIAADVVLTFGFATVAFGQPPYTYTPFWVIAASTLPITGAVFSSAVVRRLGVELEPASPLQALKLVGALGIACAICAAAGVAVFSSQEATFASMKLTIWELYGKYFIGMYVGAIFVVPAVAGLRRLVRPTMAGVRAAIQDEFSRIHRSVLAGAAMVGAGVIAAQFTNSADVLWTVRGALFVPMLVCAICFGWRGAVIGVALVIPALELTWIDRVKEENFWFVLIFGAVASSSALIVGAWSSRQRRQADQVTAEKVMAKMDGERWRDIALNQRGMPEEVLRREMAIVEEIKRILHEAEVKSRDPALRVDEAMSLQWSTLSLARRTLQARSQMLAPALLEKHGIRTALFSSPIVRELRSSGAVVRLHLTDPVDHLTRGTQLTAYQFLHQAIAHAMKDGPIVRAAIRLRTGGGKNGPWIAFKLSIQFHSAMAEQANEISPKDVAMLQSMEQLAKAYGGSIRQRPDDRCRVVTAMLFDLDAAMEYNPPAAQRPAG